MRSHSFTNLVPDKPQLLFREQSLNDTEFREGIQVVLSLGVAVVLRDQAKGLAGVAHVLGHGMHSREQCFALLDQLIQNLLDAGAEERALEGWLCGGAAVEKENRLDEFELGAMVTKRVEEWCRLKQINIQERETGGQYGFRLLLERSTLNVQIELMKAFVEDHAVEEAPRRPISADEAVRSLKPVPQILLHVLQTMSESSYDMAQLSREIRKEQVISARILSHCNRASVSHGREIRSIDQALVMIGEQALKKLLLQVALSDFMQDNAQGYSQVKGGLFIHALGTAEICEQLAKRLVPALKDSAYTAGLLHDIGKIVLDRMIRGCTPEFYRVLRTEENLLTAEKTFLGTTHPEAGTVLAKRWQLPEPLQEVIALHHEPHKSVMHRELCSLVCLSNQIMCSLHRGLGLNHVSRENLEFSLDTFKLSMSQYPALVSSLPLEELHKQVYLS